jgi:hypothetical protein
MRTPRHDDAWHNLSGIGMSGKLVQPCHHLAEEVWSANRTVEKLIPKVLRQDLALENCLMPGDARG